MVEQLTLNQWVEGSSPSGVTRPNGKIKQIAETKTVSAIFVMSLSGRIMHIVGFRGVQFVNSLNREQFVHDGIPFNRNFLEVTIVNGSELTEITTAATMSISLADSVVSS